MATPAGSLSSSLGRPTGTTGTDGLIDVNARQSVGAYLRDVWSRREYLLRVPADDLRSKNYDTVLGNLWHLLNPALLIGVYYLVFGVLLGTDRGIDNFITFLAVGVFVYQFTQKAAIQGSKAITTNEGLIRSLRFPRAILPITSVLAELLAHLPAVTVVFVIAILSGETPTWGWLVLMVALTPLQFLFNLGVAFLTARAADLFRDVENILPFVFRLLFYISGILYSVDAQVTNESHRTFFAFNPIYAFASLARTCVLGTPLNPALLISASAWSFGLVMVGFFVFKAAEHTYGRG